MKGKIKLMPAVMTVLSALYFGLFLGVGLMRNWTEARTVIGFNYKEASRGLNPNSTRFNAYDIISDEVLEKALEQMGSDLSVRQLRGALSVSPLAAGSALSAEQYYVSTEYVLTYTANLKTLRLNPRTTVDTVAEAYHAQFRESFERKTNVLDVAASRSTILILGLGVFTIGLPLLILAAGLVIFLKRRSL